MTGGPSTLHEPSSWRTYQPPRDSPSRSDSSKSNVSAPSGKCPQKMTVCVHTLRTTFAVRLPSSAGTAEGPDSSGQAT